jgi:hypothetical protein
MRTYYKWRYKESYANTYYGRTGWELRRELGRLDSSYSNARRWRVTSKKPEYKEWGDGSAIILFKTRANSIDSARETSDAEWKEVIW